MGELSVTFDSTQLVVSERLTFGRAGDLELDINPHLHRIVGEFVRQGDTWWVNNLGASLHITVVGDGGIRADLPPGARHALTTHTGTLVIPTGPTRYRIQYAHMVETSTPAVAAQPATSGQTRTFYDLTAREVDLMVSFAKPLLDGTNGAMPTYAQVAAWWNLSTSTLDNTLRLLKQKMREAGLMGDEKLDVMVRVAVSHSLITVDDLVWSNLLDDGEKRQVRRAQDGPRFRGKWAGEPS